MYRPGDLVRFRILISHASALWRWREGIAIVVGAIFLDDGMMFYEIMEADGTSLEALEDEIELV